MDDLPPEIAEFICDTAHPGDIPSLRLVSRFWNGVASPYLLHKPKLLFKQDSFDRLLEISEHPLFSNLVTHLVYQPNTLTKRNRVEWESAISTRVSITDEMSLPPGPNATEREERLYRRRCKKSCVQLGPPSKEELDNAWNTYETFLREQDDLRRRDYGFTELNEAITRFSNLRRVSMNHGWGLWHGNPDVNPYADALARAGSDDQYPDAGVPQMRSLLMALHASGVKLQSLRIGQVSWKFLMLDSDILGNLMKVLEPLECFEISISTGVDLEEDEIGIEIEECREFLEENALHNFLAAASKVEDLRVAFDWNDPYSAAEFDTTFSETRWTCLTILSLECVEIIESDWLGFLERHASTLKELDLRSIELAYGSWVDVLEGTRKLLVLDCVSLSGRLTGISPQQHFELEPDTWASHRDMRSQGNRTREALENYLVSGGVCPLRDEEEHPNTLARF